MTGFLIKVGGGGGSPGSLKVRARKLPRSRRMAMRHSGTVKLPVALCKTPIREFPTKAAIDPTIFISENPTIKMLASGS
jgi:hypothetical protein